jgi:hypothetical protein
MLLLNLIPLIDVTFSTPTDDVTSLRRLFPVSWGFERYGDVSPNSIGTPLPTREGRPTE